MTLINIHNVGKRCQLSKIKMKRRQLVLMPVQQRSLRVKVLLMVILSINIAMLLMFIMFIDVKIE